MKIFNKICFFIETMLSKINFCYKIYKQNWYSLFNYQRISAQNKQKKHFVHVLTIVYVLFCPDLVFSKNIEKINKERENSHQAFLTSLNNVQTCTEEVNDLSNRVNLLENNISQRGDFYQNISNEGDFQKGMGWRKQTLNSITNIRSSVFYLKNKCSFFASDSILEKLDVAIQALERDRWSMNYDQRWIGITKQIQLNVYNENKLRRCNSNIRKPSLNLILWFYDIQEAYIEGDIFIVNKGLSLLTILSDYISSVISFCDIEEATKKINDSKTSSDQKEVIKARLAVLELAFDNSQKMLTEAKEKFSVLNFEESSVKMCQRLVELEKDKAGICESPLDNPYWHYSASYFLNKD